MAGFKSPLVRKSAVALTVIGSALGGVLSSAKTADAQTVRTNASANVQAPQVTEEQVDTLFADVLNQNAVSWLNHNYSGDNVDAILANKLRSADEQTRALIVEAAAMGLKRQIIAATPEASVGAVNERLEGWMLNQGSLVKALIKYGGGLVNYHGDNVIFDLGVLENTNIQLRYAAKHGVVYSQYINQFVIPDVDKNPRTSTLADIDTVRTFRSFGLANTTVPANNPQR